MNILRESMTRFTMAGWIFRVWRQETDAPPYTVSCDELIKKSARLCDTEETKTIWELAEALLAMDRVNAVECIDEEKGYGQVLYKDWP